MPRNRDTDRPYFFVASCPENVETEAIKVADKYGGFHCIGDHSGMPTKADQYLVAWKGKAEGQFMTLKKLSPQGRKVIGIAVVGFGACNDEREFLHQLCKKPGNEQLVMKQCGDVSDMESWLRSEGYVPDQHPRFEQVPAASGSDSKGYFNAMISGRNSLAKERRNQEILLEAVQEVMDETKDIDKNSIDELQIAKLKLSSTIRNADAAGVEDVDLQHAHARQTEFEHFLEIAESRRIGMCGWCLRYCLDAQVFKRHESEPLVKQEAVQEAPMQTILMHVESKGQLSEGTQCCYKSASHGLVPAVVQGFNKNDNTYNLNVRQHASLERIFPTPDVSTSKAWPPGTLVDYKSNTTDNWIPAIIASFKEGVRGAKGTYDLDVRKCADVDRIRLRHK